MIFQYILSEFIVVRDNNRTDRNAVIKKKKKKYTIIIIIIINVNLDLVF